MFIGRDRLALETDLADANIHYPPGAGVGCDGCGISVLAFNPNTLVTYEGVKVLIAGSTYSPHPSPGPRGCGLSHVTLALPISDPMVPVTVDDPLVTVEGVLPIRLGDILACGSRIIPTI
jgi:hypothetical protein